MRKRVAQSNASTVWSRWFDFSRWMEVPVRPGLYEIRRGKMLLKVGIAQNLRKRITDHARSAQKRLLGRCPEPWSAPDQVASKQSILAKHLYFDRSIAPRYALRTEAGRVAFLAEQCEFRFRVTASSEAAREIERVLEATKVYRYQGLVIKR